MEVLPLNSKDLKASEIVSQISFRQHESRLANVLNIVRLKQIIKIVIARVGNRKGRVLDIGSGTANFSHLISQYCQTVAVDIAKPYLIDAKKSSNLDFVCADAKALPFVEKSFSTILCLSMLEHLLELQPVLMSLKEALDPDGILVVGYPVETWLFKLVWRFLSPNEFRFIDQTQTLFVNPYEHKTEDYWKNPTTHKQNYSTIRKTLPRYFKVNGRKKVPFDLFPDLLSYYECAELTS